MQNEITYRWPKGKWGSIALPLHPNPVFAHYGFSETFLERFWKKVNKTDHCWVWTGALNKKGYGHISYGQIDGGQMKAHRASWLIHFGEIPEETPCVLHDCRPMRDCAACVNPAHLWLGTVLDNNRDMDEKGVRVPPPIKRGEDHPMAKLDEASVERIRILYATTSVRSGGLAERFSVSTTDIHRILQGRIWAGVSPELQRIITSKLLEHPVPGLSCEKHPMAKLTKQNVITIREAYKNGQMNQPELARRFGVSQTAISRILLHKSW